MRERVLSSCKRTFSRKAFRRLPDLQETTPQAPSCWGIWESEGLAGTFSLCRWGGLSLLEKETDGPAVRTCVGLGATLLHCTRSLQPHKQLTRLMPHS